VPSSVINILTFPGPFSFGLTAMMDDVNIAVIGTGKWDRV